MLELLRHLYSNKEETITIWLCLCLVSQALPLVTVVVGSAAPGQEITVVTATKDADEPHRVDFSPPSDGSPLCPGLPHWANYVKGVIQHYRGKRINKITRSVFFIFDQK